MGEGVRSWACSLGSDAEFEPWQASSTRALRLFPTGSQPRDLLAETRGFEMQSHRQSCVTQTCFATFDGGHAQEGDVRHCDRAAWTAVTPTGGMARTGRSCPARCNTTGSRPSWLRRRSTAQRDTAWMRVSTTGTPRWLQSAPRREKPGSLSAEQLFRAAEVHALLVIEGRLAELARKVALPS